MDFIYYIFKDFVHYAAIIFLLAIIPAAIIGFIKPSIFSSRIKWFSGRQRTALGSLLSVAILVGLVAVTNPAGENQDRFDQRNAASQRQDRLAEEFEYSQQTTIEKKLVEEVQLIGFEKKEQKTDDLQTGQQKVIQKGISGKKILTYEVEYENGKEISRKLKAQDVTRQPTAQITLLGTSPAANKSSRSSGQETGCKSFYRSLFIKFYGGSCSRSGS